MQRSMRATKQFFAVTVVGVWAISASAVSLYDLSHGAMLMSGDKWFSGFTYSGIGGPDSHTVNVTAVGTGVGANLFGICIQGGFSSLNALDIGITYHVTSHGGAIKAVTQAFNFTSAGNGGIVAIGETVFDQQGGNNVAQSSIGFFLVGDYNDPPGEPNTGDQLNVNPALQSLFVTKDINLMANPGGMVGATIIYQRFAQVSVPDCGGTLMLLGGAIGCLGLARRRWNKA